MPSSGGNSENQHSDVIGTAALQRHPHQPQAGFRWRVCFRNAGEFLIADQTPEPVSTKDQGVSVFQGEGTIRKVRRNVATGAQGSGKNVTLWVELSIFSAYDATLDQPADVGMIACKSGNRSAANMVQATVADMGEVELASDDGQSGTSGAHPVELRMLGGVTLYILVSGLEGMEQGILRISAERVVVDVAHGFDGEAAGLLSSFVSAHAVSNDGEAALAKEFLVGVGLPIEIGILVIASLAADVGQAGGFDSGFRSFAVDSHN
jgi:hypothetical protein